MDMNEIETENLPLPDQPASDKSMKTKYLFGIISLSVVLFLFIGFYLFQKPVTTNTYSANNQKNNLPDSSSEGVGEMLYQYADLNNVALEKDCVFLYIPASDANNILVTTKQVIEEAYELFQTKKISVGLFTLKTTAPEYADMAKNVTLPALLVAVKGKGASFITNPITVNSILQTYKETLSTASTSPGGCSTSPSGSCATSSSGASGCTP